MDISPAIQRRIQNELEAIEREQDVRVLYACESGSRAWGFESVDSDYDVRFLYVHPRDWYLSIDDRRDVIERMLPDDLDLSGWELRKALRLMRKSNPPLYEWLRSPIVYREDSGFMVGMREVAESCYSPERCFLHYLSMAEGNVREYLRGENVWRKKYLYVLRPLLGCRWIERGLGPVPMEFEDLLSRTVEDAALIAAIHALLIEKPAGAELDRGPFVPEITEFLEVELPRLRGLAKKASSVPDSGKLDVFFRSAIDA